MKISEEGIEFIKEFEGFETLPYPDAAGFMTVGYGHLIKKGEKFSSVTPDEAEILLGHDLINFEKIVNTNVKVDLNQNQFDALVSFVFNVGEGKEGVKDGFVTLRSGKPSTMLRKLNAGDYEGAANEFPKWNRAGGVVLKGLIRRREAEKELFLS
jgi:lysozyme